MDKILEVKRLKVSFRTNSGILKAVRDISFDLERGKTLAIVGESGSGKSVTSKAIIGILAGNSIVEGGEILYDGKDMLKIKEDEMHKIRGDKISMIFQDPLSSLNPIVKIGKQITEAMLLKNKANRREAKRDIKVLLTQMRRQMIAACGDAQAPLVSKELGTLERISITGSKLEESYNESKTEALDLLSAIEDTLFKIEKKQKLDMPRLRKDFVRRLGRIKDTVFIAGYADRLAQAGTSLSQNGKAADEGTGALESVKQLLIEMTEREQPDFFAMGYYSMVNSSASLAAVPAQELEKTLREGYLKDLLDLLEKGVSRSFDDAYDGKRKAIEALRSGREYFTGAFTRQEAYTRCDALADAVEKGIDKLAIVKDSAAYTFRGSLRSAVDKYFYFVARNPKEEARFARQSAKRDRLISRGRTVTWKVVPKDVQDLDDLREDILSVIDRVSERYADAPESINVRECAEELIAYLRSKASQAVYRISQSMAREKAIKLMDEVGIREPRQRFYQYPFEFSGGMRQRIVIAIALAANPDILICDEPTTALDVTIQAQILELINKLKKERNLSVIFITHDLGVVANMADDIAVMYAGKIVEYGTADDIFYDPRHPYTWALLSSMPDLDTKEKLDAIPGTPPNMIYPPKGDAFADRNRYAMKIDFERQPPFFTVSETHKAATWLLHPDAPHVDMPEAIAKRIERMKKRDGGATNA